MVKVIGWEIHYGYLNPYKVWNARICVCALCTVCVHACALVCLSIWMWLCWWWWQWVSVGCGGWEPAGHLARLDRTSRHFHPSFLLFCVSGVHLTRLSLSVQFTTWFLIVRLQRFFSSLLASCVWLWLIAACFFFSSHKCTCMVAPCYLDRRR